MAVLSWCHQMAMASKCQSSIPKVVYVHSCSQVAFVQGLNKQTQQALCCIWKPWQHAFLPCRTAENLWFEAMRPLASQRIKHLARGVKCQSKYQPSSEKTLFSLLAKSINAFCHVTHHHCYAAVSFENGKVDLHCFSVFCSEQRVRMSDPERLLHTTILSPLHTVILSNQDWICYR